MKELEGTHPGCNYLAKDTCNKCGWIKPLTLKTPQDIAEGMLLGVDKLRGQTGTHYDRAGVFNLIVAVVEAERTRFEERLAIKLNEIGADNSNCYDLDDLFSLMKNHFEISVEAERERAKILEDALEFYEVGNEWDYGVRAREALAVYRKAASGDGG